MHKELSNPEEISFEHQSTTGKVLLALENKIIKREWKAGQRIYVEELSKQFNISQTPIREALYKLEGMGLVGIRPQRGIYVTSFSRQDVLEMLEIRMALEDLAIRRIPGTFEDLVEKMKDNLRSFKETIKTGDLAANNEIDRAFHLLIIQAAGSKQLIRIYENLYSHVGIQRLLHEDGKKALEELHMTDQEHGKIIQVFEKKNRKDMKKAVRDHLSSVSRRITESLQNGE